MKYDIKLRMPENWVTEREEYLDESGVEISHLESRIPASDSSSETALIDIYVGEMPEGETVEDQAFANYAETVGFDDDENIEPPIFKSKFNGKNAWGFIGETEDGYPIKFLAQETKKGILAIIIAFAENETLLNNIFETIEKNLRIS
ncbi:MAG: hypothetical protein MJY69_04295 [Bacteroidales bacterium]|nr:hypothetical protein [Bacteroidales bacterium]